MYKAVLNRDTKDERKVSSERNFCSRCSCKITPHKISGCKVDKYMNYSNALGMYLIFFVCVRENKELTKAFSKALG